MNGWIADNLPVRAIETSLDEAKALGAMALFGEKYGDWVRMVEVDEVSRELCGGTHVHSTGEVGLFHVTTETSSASNVRRIEAVTGAAATELFEQRTARLRELSKLMKAPEGELARAAERLGEQVKELKKKPRGPGRRGRGRRLVGAAADVGGMGGHGRAPTPAIRRRCWRCPTASAEARRVRGGAGHGRATAAAAGGQRGARAGRARREGRRDGRRAAEVAGGGGGGRDTVAQAGGGDPAKADDALAAARAAIEILSALPRRSVRVLALDHGEARCGCAVSDPSGTLGHSAGGGEAPGFPQGPGPHRRAGGGAGGREGGGRAADHARRPRGRPGRLGAGVRRAAGGRAATCPWRCTTSA